MFVGWAGHVRVASFLELETELAAREMLARSEVEARVKRRVQQRVVRRRPATGLEDVFGVELDVDFGHALVDGDVVTFRLQVTWQADLRW